MDIGLLVPVPGTNPELSTLLSEIERAEAAGFASVWMPNTRGFDALTVLALAGPRTRSIELGTAVVPTYPRHPAALAERFSPGRNCSPSKASTCRRRIASSRFGSSR